MALIPTAYQSVRNYDLLTVETRHKVILDKMLISLGLYKKPEDFIFVFSRKDITEGDGERLSLVLKYSSIL